MEFQAKDFPATNLCQLCSNVERSYFCASPTPSDDSGRRTIWFHESLGDLVNSAADGCGLCEVFLQGFLHAQVKVNHFTDTQAVKDYLLAKEHLALRTKFEKDSSKWYYSFHLDLKAELFLVPGLEHEVHSNLGFVSVELQRYWDHEYDFDAPALFLITSEPECAAYHEGHFYGRAIPTQPNVHFAGNLLRECQLSHKCTASQASDQRQMPTRLIVCHKGPGRDPSLKLVEDRNLQPYLALSYRWATEMDCVTRLENIEERKTNLDWNILPKTFKDAVSVTLALGYTYLWIDCLCIVQDDSHDWETECPKMAYVYGYADLTIAAVTATDPYAGFLGARNILNTRSSCKLRYWNEQELPAGVVMIEYVGDDEEQLLPGFHNLLDQRGWTLQERILSTRVLSFSKDKIFWECNAVRRLESLHFVRANDRRGFRTIKQDLRALDRSNVYRWWYEILDDYCRRHLTFPMDKLPAISGIASMLKKITGDTYLAGLWQNDISSGLAWSSSYSHTDRTQYDTQLPCRAPSWSWARSDCGRAKSSFPVVDEFNETIHGYVEFISAKINLRGEDQYGQVEPGAKLCIRAPTKQGFMGRGTEAPPGQFSHHAEVVIRLPYTTTDLSALRVSIDDPKFLFQILDQSTMMTKQWSEEHQGLQVTTARLCNCEVRNANASLSYGLVLMSTEDGGNFRRVGLLDSAFQGHNQERTAIDDWFSDSEMQDLTLV